MYLKHPYSLRAYLRSLKKYLNFMVFCEFDVVNCTDAPPDLASNLRSCSSLLTIDWIQKSLTLSLNRQELQQSPPHQTTISNGNMRYVEPLLKS